MASKFQSRLVGTIILVAIGVIVLPDVLDGKKTHYKEDIASIPIKPELDSDVEKFEILDGYVDHRVGDLQIGEIAVAVHVSSVHRGPAFDACEYIIDELKVRVPIWKKEHYTDGDSGWVECHECAKHQH